MKDRGSYVRMVSFRRYFSCALSTMVSLLLILRLQYKYMNYTYFTFIFSPLWVYFELKKRHSSQLPR